ncbi:mandelate racemase/muconate lactonizing enzyme family protein [Bauldia sp.]|uniref:mandelate racemase/muconate lactonizing enzyme family protein n=1 Tax=Bauldia sp. TaxID=2575872 RepID=UPI003BAC7A59
MTMPHRIANIRLTDVVVNQRTTWRHVELMTESGLTGVGEATLDDAGPDYSARLLEAGQQILDRPLATDALDPLRLRLRDLQGRTILSALDQAVADLRAQIACQPLCVLLGAGPTDILLPLYANINRATAIRTPRAFAQNARSAADEGYQAIKLAPFDGLTPELCDKEEGHVLIDAGLARIRATREVVPVCDLMVDCHWRLTPTAATALLPPLRDLGVTWLECPLPETTDAIPELRALRDAANRHDMRLCGLETAGDWAEFAPFVEGGAYDVIMPDVKHAGGLESLLNTGRRGRAAGISVSLHNPSGPVAHLCSTHVMAALGGHERMEIQWNESPIFNQITSPAPITEAGACRPTSTPGLGATLNESAAQQWASE